MTRFRILLCWCLWMLAWSSMAQTNTVYTCPMHPEVTAAKPGKCPKCGMFLVQKKVAKAAVKPSAKKKSTLKTLARKTDTPTKVEATGTIPDPHAHHQMQGEMTDTTSQSEPNIRQAKANLGRIRTITSPGPKTVRYDLHVRDTTVTYGNKAKHAIAVNGQIPMPVLTFTEGDTAEIHVYNDRDEETALHWHGLFLPNTMDGVPYLTQMPIRPHSEYVYKFPLVQSGTHWYHSHSGLQEQIGMYGMFIINKKEEWDIPTIPVMISEWTDRNPHQVERRLKNASDWFSIQKGTTQSYSEAIAQGHFATKITNEWKRMNAMDVSDVYYDAFLVNGRKKEHYPRFRGGDKVRLRIANGGASDYFWLTWAGGKITVVASDGNEVEPVEVDRLIIATSETYDVVVTLPEDKNYEFRITPEDRTGSASIWLGSGPEVPADALPRLDYFAGMKMMNAMMDGNGNMKEMDGMKMQNQVMDMNTVMYRELEQPKMDMPKDSHDSHSTMDHMAPAGIVTLNYDMLRAPEKTTLPGETWRELQFELTGNMNRYVWSLDNKTLSESDRILIKKGENLRIILYNNSMMRHPMHLHGHDFRIVNSQDEHAPLKNVLDIMPMERDTLEFRANAQGGDWFFHCHILYHMMSGMGRIFRYEDGPPNPEITNPALAQRKLYADDRRFHLMADNDFATNGNDGMAMLSNTRWNLSTEWRLGYNDHHGYETETHLGRYIGRMQWFMPFIGFDFRYRHMDHGERETNWFGQSSTKDKRAQLSIGAAYTLPMLMILQGEIYHDGNVRFQLMREDIPLTPRLRGGFMVNTDGEYVGELRYILTRFLGVRTHYDSDMGFGVGVSLNY